MIGPAPDDAAPPMPALACAGCGTVVEAISPAGVAWRCPRAGEGDVDHVLRVTPRRAGGAPGADGSEAGTASTALPRFVREAGALVNPFLRYRHRLAVYAAARAIGITDAGFAALVTALDARVAEVDGRGFRVTPSRVETTLALHADLPCGQLITKVECGNVAGSHKGRHLFGLALWLAVEGEARARGVLPPVAGPPPRLAIASCGNAALAAAVVARAAGRDLDVFVPTWADAAIVSRLQALGATVAACARQPGVAGDPCYHGFQDAVARGAVPFCCQGPDNGLGIEGGETIAWELLDALDGEALDAVFVQVGGGALATAIADGFLEASRAGRCARLPRLHAVQARGCAPLVRAYDAVVAWMLARDGYDATPIDTLDPASAPIRRDRAMAMHAVDQGHHEDRIDAALRHAATHRAAFMRPWETEPRSLATGILDDETYDWLAVVEAMLRTGGYPVLAAEETLALACRLAQEAAGIDASMTGTAGLAGLIDAAPLDARLARERVGLVITGARRDPGDGVART